jgi:hypothetical protein
MIEPEELRKLADRHLGEGPPYVKHLYESCCALRQAADEIQRLRAELADSLKSQARWITLMGEAKAERGEMRQERDEARNRLRLAEAVCELVGKHLTPRDHLTDLESAHHAWRTAKGEAK